MGIQGEQDRLEGWKLEEEVEQRNEETIQMKVKDVAVVQMAKAMGRPREDLSWEELMDFNQKALSIFIDARNAHIHTTRIDREGQTRDMARVRAITQPNAGA